MGNTLENYRAAIGAFYSVTHKLICSKNPGLNVNARHHLYCIIKIFCLLSMASFVRNDQFKFYRLVLLLICMDVHTNPGPSMDEIYSLDIIHLNTRSIRNKVDYLSNLVESFQIACFSETHLDAETESSSLILDGFDEPLRKDRNRNGGGIMVYISSQIKYIRRHDLEDARIETIWVELKLKDIKLLLCCLYRSDFTASQSIFITEIQNSIETALDYTPHVILTGDINIDFLNLTNTQLRDCMALYNLKNVISGPTRVTVNSSTLIDPVIVSDAFSVLDSGTLDVDGFISDHKATYISIQINLNMSNSYHREVWNYKNANYTLLNNLIEAHKWDTIINDTSTIDQACKSFTDIFLTFCKECIPCKKVLIRQNDKPWFSTELRYNIRLRDRLRKRYFRTKRDADRLSFKVQRNKVNNMIKYAKDNFINKIDDFLINQETGNSCKTFWQVMGRFMGKKGTSIIIPPLRKNDNTFGFTDYEKAEELNSYFASISTVDDKNIELPQLGTRSDAIFTHIQVTESEVIDILKTLKVNKATGPDGISNRMLKYTCNTICVPLTKLFNLSLKVHTYPVLWKTAHVMPLFKKGDKSLTNNYRPVSLTSNISKSFERIIFKHLYNHITENELLYKYQSGFLPGHSTIHHLIELTHNTCISLENYEANCQVFCDISKAFDRVWHRGLLYKLEKYGIKGEVLLWINSYLTSRKQKVFVNGVLSNEKELNAGVPQGSVLGPLLFLLYINDIADELTGKARLYADDTSLSYSSSDCEEIEIIINNDLKKLKEWANKWLINFNPVKTEYMLISNIFHEYDLQLLYDNTPLNFVETHKHLGIHLSANNKWTKHIDSVIDSASKQVSYLRKLKYKVSKNTLEKLYCTYIRPLLEYGSEIWDGCTITDANRLEQVQLNAARIVTGLPIFASLRSLYYETGWDTLAERRKRRKLTLMYKIVNGNVPSYLTDLLPNRVNEANNYNLRNRNDFKIPFSRLCSYESSFLPSTLKLWNNLEPDIRSLTTLSQFKSNITTTSNKPVEYTNVGERKYNIILRRIRYRCSNLKADLFRVNIVSDSSCSCGASTESAEHYFFDCELYNDERNMLFQSLDPNININIQVLTSGSIDFETETNKAIILLVLRYIKNTHRFD